MRSPCAIPVRMMRFRVRHFCCFVAVSFILSILWFIPIQQSGHFVDHIAPMVVTCPTTSLNQVKMVSEKGNQSWLQCIVDDLKNYQCLMDEASGDVYFPFYGFLKKRFDVSGRFLKGGKDHFEWLTSYAKVRFPNFTEYDHYGAFGHFASYNVETRDRVRCISGDHGVPMSTQWSSLPYYYAVQIAQYGLQHYSRLLLFDDHKSYTLGNTLREWRMHSEAQVNLSQQFDPSLNSSLITFSSQGNAKLRLLADERALTLSFQWLAEPDASFHIMVALIPSGKIIRLNYIQKQDDRCVWSEKVSDGMDFYYALGTNWSVKKWRMVCRNLLADTGRAMALTLNKKDNFLLHPGDVRLVEIWFVGKSSIMEMRQRSPAYYENFIASADWLVDNQDDRGGWQVPVDRSIAEKRLVLRSGWYSAMAQGHALSLLTRVYHVTKNSKYLRAADLALNPFKTSVSNGGIVNEFFGHQWYEEYPTNPGTFVLNGFIYALIGLYDFAQLSSVNGNHLDADSLFQSGVQSLRSLLPLFDTGSGSLYDLRHVGLKTAPNLARWDYHSVHIYLLKWLSIITDDNFFNETALRWANYSAGHRAKHN